MPFINVLYIGRMEWGLTGAGFKIRQQKLILFFICAIQSARCGKLISDCF